jgi:hypothetical protein
MSSARRLPCLLLALLVWSVGVPVVALTCVPSAPCAGLMAACPLDSAHGRGGQPVVGSPDCCQRDVRDDEPPAMPGAKSHALELAALAVTVSLVPPAPPALWRPTSAEPAAAGAIPLYTLHSIMLILGGCRARCVRRRPA